MSDKAEHWSGGVGFILATIGSAVGLGSIWKFPYEAGANGGSGFILFYLCGLALIVVPLMLAEFAIGRRGRADAATCLARLAAAHGASRRWALVGWLGVAAACLILSFYSVVAGWALAYLVETVRHGLAGTDAAAVQQRFAALLATPVTVTACHAAVIAATGFIVARGIAGGIEAACKVLMPALIALMIILAVYSALEGDARATARFLFRLNWQSINADVALDAVGLGFFSIGVGLAIMTTYAAYAGTEINLKEAAVVTVVGDTVISFLAGFAVFPVVFAEGLDPASGPGLMFVTVPLAFAHIPFGEAAAAAFFALLIVAALASTVSMLEMPVALLCRQFRWPRGGAAAAAAALCWFIGMGSVLSFNRWATWFPLRFVPGLEQATVFDLVDRLTSQLMLPIGGLLLSIFAGWIMAPRVLDTELRLGAVPAALLRISLRYVAPACIAATMLFALVD